MTMPTARIFEGARGTGRCAWESVGARSWGTLLESQFLRKSAVNNTRICEAFNASSFTLFLLASRYHVAKADSPPEASSWRYRIMYDPLRQPRRFQKIRSFDFSKCNSLALIRTMTANWISMNWRFLCAPSRVQNRTNGRLFRGAPRDQRVHVRLHPLLVFVGPLRAGLLVSLALRPRDGRIADGLRGFART